MAGLWKAAVAAAVLAGSAALAQPAQAPPAPMVQVDGLKSISRHVQVIPDNSRPIVPNVGFVVGTKGVLVIDTGLGPANGAAVAAVAQKLAPGRQIWLVATHAHPEHDLGAQAFPAGAKLIRSADQDAAGEADMNLAKVFAGRSPAIADLLKDAKFRPADVRFTGTHTLDLGGVTARILAAPPSHTDGDTAVWVAQDRVLFSGDLAMRAQPSIGSPKATLATWAKSLDMLAALKPAIVVPSHGPMGDAGFIEGYRAYLKEVSERTAQAKAGGMSLEAATTAVSDAMASQYTDRGRLAGAVRMAYQTASLTSAR